MSELFDKISIVSDRTYGHKSARCCGIARGTKIAERPPREEGQRGRITTTEHNDENHAKKSKFRHKPI
jgi:hypothetical protein